MICDGSVPNEVTVIIGNGFDIECGLPTDYKSFLRFLGAVDILLASGSSTKNAKEKAIKDVELKEEIRKNLIEGCYDDYEYWEALLKGYWYTHFQTITIKNNWIDFENEISKVITQIENSMYLKDGNIHLTGDDYLILPNDSELNELFPYFLSDIKRSYLSKPPNIFQYEISYRDLAKRLVDDLEMFIEGFEKYLLNFVSLITPDYKASIKELISKLKLCSSNYVLSFNYTNTLEKMLQDEDIKAEFCYVHGKACNSARNNMVLGIEEHLQPEDISKYIPFAPFRKYNQRIFKETDSRYVDWITRMKRQERLRRHLYIFGHSLGLSDKDILEPFVMSPHMDTYVYYRNLESFSKKVGNMTAIIEMKNMIRMNGGTERNMAFIPQATETL